MKRIMKYTAVILATLLVLIILWQFRLVLLLFTLSLFVAAGIRPFVRQLMHWGLTNSTAQLIIYGLGIGGFVLLFLLAGDLVLQQFNATANQAVVQYESLHRQWQASDSWTQSLAAVLPPPFTPADAQAMDLENMLPVMLTLTQNIAGGIGSLILMLALSIYWSTDQNRFERLWFSLLTPRSRAYTRDAWRSIEEAVGSYVRSQTVQSILAALLLGIGSYFLGLPAFVVAFLGAIATFIPLFGGLLIALVAFGLGSLQSLGLGIGAAVYSIIVFIVLEMLIEPRLWPRERRGFLLTFLIIVPLLELFGVWGLLVAPPLSAAIEVLIGQAYQASLSRQVGHVHIHDLQERHEKLVATTAVSATEQLSPELRSLSDRLAQLLTKLHDIAEA
ncbi:MAG: AI-2E family transporter [Anaerolineales bacterium]|nr:AI-2E family transporter [Anaerolineales bacterium]